MSEIWDDGGGDGGGGGGGIILPPVCLLKGTLITLPSGTKKIEDIKTGDVVSSFDIATNITLYSAVENVFYHFSPQYLIINSTLRITNEHPVRVNNSWINAGNIKIGDTIFTQKGWILVESIENVVENVEVYNIEVAQSHNYYADGYLVHNKGGGGGGGDGGGGGGGYWPYIPDVPPSPVDEKVKASASDTTGYLDSKVTGSVAIINNKLSLKGEDIRPSLNGTYYGQDKGVKGFFRAKGTPGGNPSAIQVNVDDYFWGDEDILSFLSGILTVKSALKIQGVNYPGTTGSTTTTFELANGGRMYEVGDIVELVQVGGGSGATFRVDTIETVTAPVFPDDIDVQISPDPDGWNFPISMPPPLFLSGGKILTWTQLTAGSNYVSENNATLTGGTGFDALVDVFVEVKVGYPSYSLDPSLELISKDGLSSTGLILSTSQVDKSIQYTFPTDYPADDGYKYFLHSDKNGIWYWMQGGAKWLSSITVPVSTSGDVGDWDIDTITGNVYEKTAINTWTFRFNMSGGSKWHSVISSPANILGNIGDWALDIVTGDIYEKTDVNTWTFRLNITGTGGGGNSPLTEDGSTYAIWRTNQNVIGDDRGEKAVDLVYEREIASQVASGDFSGILSGKGHTVEGLRSVIVGGNSNIIDSAYLLTGAGEGYSGNSFIGGGYQNYILDNHLLCTIGGGAKNQITANGGTYAQMITIGGGYNNIISSGAVGTATAHTIGGGELNNITGAEGSTISGGKSNSINDYANFATIGGGLNNTIVASGQYGCVTGGRANTAGAYSFACGYNANGSNVSNCFIFADGTLTTVDRANQFKVGANGGFYLRNNAGNFDWRDDGAGKWLSTPNGGCYLGSDGVWYSASSREIKHGFTSIDTADILQKVSEMSLQEWRYNATPNSKHIGVMAEDFVTTFGIGDNPEGLNPLDVCGILWAAVQALTVKINALTN